MKKLYYAKATIDVIFSAEETCENLNNLASSFMIEQYSSDLISNLNLEIKEIKTIEEVPNEWLDLLYWGEKEDLTPRKYFLRAFI